MSAKNQLKKFAKKNNNSQNTYLLKVLVNVGILYTSKQDYG